MSENIKLYALSTCGWCKKTKRLLQESGIDYEVVDVDLLEGDEKEEARTEVARYNPRRSFPTLVVGDNVIVGFDEKRIKDALGI